MIYVFDSSALIVLFKNYYRNRFPSLWEKFDYVVKERMIISVREVFNEIEGRGDHLSDWVKGNRTFFEQPFPEELVFIAEIFKVPHFRYLVSDKQRLAGKPVADPFVIAKAKALNGCVVTQEINKPNAARIPNICEHFGIHCSDLEGFMEKEDWIF